MGLSRNNELKRDYHRRFQLDLEAGLGTTDAPTTAPLMYLRWSDDSGHTWSSYYEMSAGAAGEYTKRLFRNRLGSARQRIYEISTTDDAKWNVLAAYLEFDQGSK